MTETPRKDTPLRKTHPSEITHVWTMSTWSSGDGFRWSAETDWARFTKIAPQ